MKDFTANEIEFITFSFKANSYSRSKRRALINEMANGVPPLTQKEAEENRTPINYNDLTHTRECHDARSQFTQAFTKTSNYFTCKTDAGARHKRMGYSKIVTREISKIMKRSLPYYETMRGKWASTVLHGIAPCVFEDSDKWASRPLGVDDVYVPGNTELYDIAQGTVPLMAIYRSFKAPQLIKLAKGPKRDPGWNEKLVNACLKWIDQQTLMLAGNEWQDYLSPEKWVEREKSDGAFYCGDMAPAIKVWDFYFWNNSKGKEGWNRRMILDPWTMADAGGIVSVTRNNDTPTDNSNRFLYNSGDRKWASKLTEIINWQFADLSAVNPFLYYSVRSLGWLLYSVCHVQNRLNCRFTAAMFEQLMILMRIKSQDDMQRALSVNLIDQGFIDDSISFIPASERYQVNANLAQLGLDRMSQIISRSSSSFTSQIPSGGSEGVPTATQWLGMEQKVNQLVSAGIQQAYNYQIPEYREQFRRFTKKHSKDPEVQECQAKILKEVPPEVLYELSSWEIDPERVIGGGNKTTEMMVSDWLVNHMQMYEPDGQHRIKQVATLAVTDDAALTDELVPERAQVSNSVLDAQQSVGTLLMAQPMELRQNVSHAEYAQALIDALQVEIAKINAIGGVPESNVEIIGMQNLAGVTIEGQPVPGNGAANHIALLAQDKESKSIVKVLGDSLNKAMNEVKAFAQRLQEQQQSQAQQGGQLDAETQAKIISMEATTQAKIQNTQKSHASRTAQRAVQFEMEEQRKNQQTQANIARQNAEAIQELQAQAAKDALEIQKQAITTQQQAENVSTKKPSTSSGAT